MVQIVKLTDGRKALARFEKEDLAELIYNYLLYEYETATLTDIKEGDVEIAESLAEAYKKLKD